MRIPLLAALASIGWTAFAFGQDPPPVVAVTHPVEREMAGYEEFKGVAEAAQAVDLRPRMSGYLVRIMAQDGSQVKAGDMLFELDARQLVAAFDRARAEMEQARAQTQLTGANLARARKLVDSKAISAEELRLAESEHLKSETAILAAQAQVEKMKLQLDQTRITAPISGILGRLPISVGNAVGPETLLGTLVSSGPMNVRFGIDEKTFLTLEVRGRTSGKPVAITAAFADDEGFPHACVLESTDNRFDPQSGTLQMRARLPDIKRNLLPGLSVRVRMAVTEPYRAMVVPDSAVARDAQGAYVLVVDESSAIVRQGVTLGSRQEGWQAVKGGLSPKDRVVMNLEGVASPARGAKVTPRLVTPGERP